MKQRERKKTENLEVRLPYDMKAAFMAACKDRGVSASVVLRAFIERYIRSASPAPNCWKKELKMPFTGGSRTRRVVAGAIGAGTAAVAALSLSVPARAAVDARLGAVFEWMDLNRDGSLSRAEFERSEESGPATGVIGIMVSTRTRPSPDETREQLFRRLDTDGNGGLSLSEVAADVIVETSVTPAIAAADYNRDGAVTEGELAAYLVTLGTAAGVKEPAAGAGLMAHGIIAAHDQDLDGKVLLTELRS